MANFFSTHGRALLANGFLIIPIKPGRKSPALDAWQSSRLGAADLDRYPGCGVGVLCGQGAHPIAAIDIDTLNEELAARFVAWCAQHLGVTCERVGRAPKILLPYRADADGWGKATGAWFENDSKARHRVEVLGKGQQFVAYHIHPDTNEPYEWVDLLGGLDAMRADDLPIITQDQVVEALRVFEEMAVECGLHRVSGSDSRPVTATAAVQDDDPLMAYDPPIGVSLDDVKARLKHVDNEDYDTWLKVGMALHHEFEGGADALATWDQWSSTASNYVSSEDLELRWSGFRDESSRKVTAKWLLKVSTQNKRDAVRAEKRGALEEARERIADCQDSIDLLGDVAHLAGEASADDIAIKAELAGLIKARFKKLTGAALSAVDLRAAMQGGKKNVPAKGCQPKRASTELGNSDRFLDRYAEGLMFVPDFGTWFLWTATYWRQSKEVELEHLAKETIRALPEEVKQISGDAERAEFFKHCAASQKNAMAKNMVQFARSDPRVVVMANQLDKDNLLLGVGNGVVDLRTGKLLKPKQEHRITTITEVEYHESATAPLFRQTVSDVFFDDQEMVDFFQRLIGYSLLGQPDADIMVIPYGSGSNGKSTVLTAIRDALGEHAKTSPADTLLANGGGGSNSAGGARPDILRLRGARFVYVTEPDEGSELREGLVKAMTGGEAIAARPMYCNDYVELKPTWTVFMPTNHKPIIKGSDYAIWRRLLPVPFTRNFDADPLVEKDEDRAKRLSAEVSGILRWCVEGALQYQKVGLRIPEKVKEAREEYKNEMDILRDWLAECCEVGGDYVTLDADLWASWEMWARANGMLKYVSSKNLLTRRLVSRQDIETDKSNGKRRFFGIKIKAISDF